MGMTEREKCYAPINCMPHGTPPPLPGDGGDLTRVGVKCILNPHPGDRRNGQITPPCTRGDHSADWRRSMCPTPLTHLVVKFPTLGQSEAVKSPVVSPGGGGLAIDRCIRYRELKRSSLSECTCASCASFGERGVWGQFHGQVESPGGQLGIVASTPVMAAESRVELRRGHNVRTGASSG